MSRRVLELTLHRYGLETPFELLTRMRLHHAEQLLRETDHSIERIAEACGFAEMRSFSRWFRKHRALPATHFRKQIRGS